ncbi:hypothetical protein TorRG33x02_072230, partial [Trema orientale]
RSAETKSYVLSCENNLTVWYLFPVKYHVEAIHYNNQTIRVVDPGVQKGNCSSLPLYSLTGYNFSTYGSYGIGHGNREGTKYVPLTKPVIFMTCEKPVKSQAFRPSFNEQSGRDA